jgi:hypothetical protein
MFATPGIVILAAEGSTSKSDLILLPDELTSGETWVPSSSDIHELEQVLWRFLQENSHQLSGIDPSSYWRQYLGFYRRSGLLIQQNQKLIFINGFLRHRQWLEKDLQRSMLSMLVDDGGASYWRAYYHQRARAITNFSTNGYA